MSDENSNIDNTVKYLKGMLQTAKTFHIRTIGVKPIELEIVLDELQEYKEELASVLEDLKELKLDYADIVDERLELVEKYQRLELSSQEAIDSITRNLLD